LSEFAVKLKTAVDVKVAPGWRAVVKSKTVVYATA
jgi:hypothetical protein